MNGREVLGENRELIKNQITLLSEIKAKATTKLLKTCRPSSIQQFYARKQTCQPGKLITQLSPIFSYYLCDDWNRSSVLHLFMGHDGAIFCTFLPENFTGFAVAETCSSKLILFLWLSFARRRWKGHDRTDEDLRIWKIE